MRQVVLAHLQQATVQDHRVEALLDGQRQIVLGLQHGGRRGLAVEVGLLDQHSGAAEVEQKLAEPQTAEKAVAGAPPPS